MTLLALKGIYVKVICAGISSGQRPADELAFKGIRVQMGISSLRFNLVYHLVFSCMTT